MTKQHPITGQPATIPSIPREQAAPYAPRHRAPTGETTQHRTAGGDTVALPEPVAGTDPAPPEPRPVLPAARVAGVAALVLTLVVAAVAVLLVGTQSLTRSSTLSAGDLANVERSVVRLTMMTGPGSSQGWGSGTIVGSDGLILTNAHVADPTAHGLAAQYGVGERRAEATPVKYLLVGVSSGQGRPVHDRYRARVVVVDGYVDLAVVKIYANADGSPLTGELDLPALPIGDSDATQAGDQLTVLGFPGAADSDSVTVNTGEVAGLSRDPHMDSSRAFFDSSATVRHGNSGGSAVNAAGELVGVPTRLKPTAEGDLSYRVRPVSFARPLLAKARAGGDPSYLSPYLVQPTGHEHVRFVGVTDEESDVCTTKASNTLPSGTTHFWSVFAVTGAARHLDLYPVVGHDRSGTFVIDFFADPATPADTHCFYTEVKSDSPVPDGTYQARMLSGPDADKLLGEAATFTIGASSTGATTDGTTGGGAEGTTSAADTLHEAFPGTATPEWACVPDSERPSGATYEERCKFPADPAVTSRFYVWDSVEAENAFVGAVRQYVASHGTSLSDDTWTVSGVPCGAMVTARWNQDGTVTIFGFYSAAPYSFVVNAPTQEQAVAAFKSEAFPLKPADQLPAPQE